jgi:hypothetical protein
MNRRGFLSLFSAAPAAMIPIAATATPLEKTLDGLKLSPEAELMVACAGPQWSLRFLRDENGRIVGTKVVR